MTKFEEPNLEVIKFKSKDTIITLSSYTTAGSDDNSYINEDEYNRVDNPWQ